MTLLLDTHLSLWAAGDPGQLSSKAQALLGDPATELMFSTASIWEVIIKNALGRSDFCVDPQQLWNGLIQNDYSKLGFDLNTRSLSDFYNRFTRTPSTVYS